MILDQLNGYDAPHIRNIPSDTFLNSVFPSLSSDEEIKEKLPSYLEPTPGSQAPVFPIGFEETFPSSAEVTASLELLCLPLRGAFNSVKNSEYILSNLYSAADFEELNIYLKQFSIEKISEDETSAVMLTGLKQYSKQLAELSTKYIQLSQIVLFYLANIDKDGPEIRERAKELNGVHSRQTIDSAQIKTVLELLTRRYNTESSKGNPDQAFLKDLARVSDRLQQKNPFLENSLIVRNTLGNFTEQSVVDFLALYTTGGPKTVSFFVFFRTKSFLR